jgi:uncharacterized membrane protein
LTRGFLLIIGFGAAAIAGYVFLTGVDPATWLGQSAPDQLRSEPESHGEIDEKSRERLRTILREADKAPSD